MEKRDLYLQKIKAQLEQYSAKTTEMHGKATEVNVDVKLEYLKQMEMLEGKRDGLKKKYEQLSKATEISWKDIKEGTENAWNALKDSVAKAANQFK